MAPAHHGRAPPAGWPRRARSPRYSAVAVDAGGRERWRPDDPRAPEGDWITGGGSAGSKATASFLGDVHPRLDHNPEPAGARAQKRRPRPNSGRGWSPCVGQLGRGRRVRGVRLAAGALLRQRGHHRRRRRQRRRWRARPRAPWAAGSSGRARTRRWRRGPSRGTEENPRAERLHGERGQGRPARGADPVGQDQALLAPTICSGARKSLVCATHSA